ncbi:signal peptide peptidase SppA [Burkholderiaceae bacterium UC74_6]
MSVFKSIGWLFSKLWWLLDGTRRAILNLLLLLLIIWIVWGIATRGPKPLQDKTVLTLNLDGMLVEQFSGSARSQALARLRGNDVPRQTRLRDVVRVLELAAKDPKISSLLLNLDDFSGAGPASLREVAAAITRFKTSGKPVLAYGDGYSQRGYLLAAQAKQIYMHPMGEVNLTGFGGYRLYYKDALDRLGISANVIKAGAYKSFGEPYANNAPSKEALDADRYLYDALWTRYTGAVEEARKLDAGAVTRSINELPQRLAAAKGDGAKLALDNKLIDGLKTRDEMRALLIKDNAAAEGGKTFRQIAMLDYLDRHPEEPVFGDHVAIVVAEGEIVDGDAGAGRVGGDSTARLIRSAREDEHVKAVLLRINSPGGSAFASEIVRRELELTQKAGKPVIVSMGDVAASGGYWISMSSDHVYADPTTITGSIGVFAMLPTGEKLLEKLSVHSGGYGTTWAAGGFDPRRGLDPRLASVVQAGVLHTYDSFTTLAAKARKKTQPEIDAVAQGRVWTGAQALDRGLVDELGSFGDALKAANKAAKLADDAHPVWVEKQPGRFERLLDSLDLVIAPSIANAVRAQLGFTPPPAVQDAVRELASLQQLTSGNKPYESLVHCLCKVP